VSSTRNRSFLAWHNLSSRDILSRRWLGDKILFTMDEMGRAITIMTCRLIQPRTTASALRVVWTLAILLLPLSVACPSYVRAHAIVLTSDPADGSTTRAPRRLTLHFNSRVEKSLCSVSLVGPEPHHRARLRQAASSSEDILVYALPDLAPGAYQARWKVLSADGHLTEGAVRFVVDGR